MKKFLLIILIAIFALPSWAINEKMSLDIIGQTDEKASEILYNYLLKVSGMSSQEISDYPKIMQENVRAVEIDLNNSGVNEVIGFVYSPLLHSDSGYELFILENNNDEWQDLAYCLDFEPMEPIEIQKKKSQYYNNIKFLTTKNDRLKSVVAKFKNGIYME